MKIGLFAAGQVGHQIAKFFGENREPLSFLVVDVNDPFNLNTQIIADSQILPECVYLSHQLREDAVLEMLAASQTDLIILAWWPYILKEPQIRLARVGCLNFHPSFLPYNRGKHYNFWNIVEDVPFGVTIHFVDTGIDTGDLAFQSTIQKSWEDTGKSLYDKAQAEIVRLFVENYPRIKLGQIPRTPQDLSRGTFHKGSELEAASEIFLDRQYKARDLLNVLRARTFPPHPGAWFIDQDVKYEIRIQITSVPDESL